MGPKYLFNKKNSQFDKYVLSIFSKLFSISLKEKYVFYNECFPKKQLSI